jgi:hypothetical protein
MIQSDQNISVHLMITIQTLHIMLEMSPAERQGQGDTRLTLTHLLSLILTTLSW